MDPTKGPPETQDPENPWPRFPNKVLSSPLNPEKVSTFSKKTGLDTRAGFLKRVSAFGIDLILLNLLTVAFIEIGAAAENLAQAHSTNPGLLGSLEQLSVLYVRLWSFLFFVYFSFYTFYGGQTPGKMVFKIRVVTSEGMSLSWIQSILRTFSYGLDLLTMGLGFLLAILPPSKRALHDYTSGTIVVRI